MGKKKLICIVTASKYSNVQFTIRSQSLTKKKVNIMHSKDENKWTVTDKTRTLELQ